MDVASWIAEQDALRPRVVARDAFPPPRVLGGFDAQEASDGSLHGALVLLDAATLAPIASFDGHVARPEPYVSGFLGFREVPLLAAIWALADRKPDVLWIDGAGLLHPRRVGAASQAGLALDVPTIGITKTPFIGEVGHRIDDVAEIRERGELLGYALWPEPNAKPAAPAARHPPPFRPIFVSPGHRVSAASALALTRQSLRPGERIPEPIRLADAAARAAAARKGS